jgi:hypothetical protein
MASPFTQPDMTTMDAAEYKASLDAAIQVLAKMGAGFAPRAQLIPNLTIQADPGANYSMTSGSLQAYATQSSPAVTAPVTNPKIVRFYINKDGVLQKIDGAESASPIAPTYPANAYPIGRVTLAVGVTQITNAMITDERPFATQYGTPKNTFLFTSSQAAFTVVGALAYRITMAGGGGGAGAGVTNAAGTSHAGGGAGGGAASILSRFVRAATIDIVIGSGGPGGTSGLTNGAAVQTVAQAGQATTVTVDGVVMSAAGGGLGGSATPATPTAGTAGAAGVVGTGVAGTAGTAGTTGAAATGGKGGSVGNQGLLSVGPNGGTISPAARSGIDGKNGSGGSGGVGTGGDGGDGGDGFVLIEVF